MRPCKRKSIEECDRVNDLMPTTLNELRAGHGLTALVLAVASIGAGLLASALGYALGTHA